jgi:hypothetical protein
MRNASSRRPSENRRTRGWTFDSARSCRSSSPVSRLASVADTMVNGAGLLNGRMLLHRQDATSARGAPRFVSARIWPVAPRAAIRIGTSRPLGGTGGRVRGQHSHSRDRLSPNRERSR